MFTLDQIKSAHSQVKSGADFPRYVQELINLDLTQYDYYVSDGHTVYFGENDFQLESPAKYPTLTIAEKSDAEAFSKILKAHQQGQSDFSTFCHQAADSGVEKWTVDTVAMTCAYYDQAGNTMLVEKIPRV